MKNFRRYHLRERVQRKRECTHVRTSVCVARGGHKRMGQSKLRQTVSRERLDI